MSTEHNGGPAFPLSTSSGSNESVNGMSLLDYFAGQALAGLLSDATISGVTPDGYAESSYDYVESMIAESNKRNRNK
jgi:hypothetical protein